jgi:hypothetical protein
MRATGIVFRSRTNKQRRSRENRRSSQPTPKTMYIAVIVPSLIVWLCTISGLLSAATGQITTVVRQADHPSGQIPLHQRRYSNVEQVWRAAFKAGPGSCCSPGGQGVLRTDNGWRNNTDREQMAQCSHSESLQARYNLTAISPLTPLHRLYAASLKSSRCARARSSLRVCVCVRVCFVELFHFLMRQFLKACVFCRAHTILFGRFERRVYSVLLPFLLRLHPLCHS